MTQDIRKVKDLLRGVQKNLECAICLELLSDPVSTKCNHQFCRQCIQRLLSQKKSKNTTECPLCKDPVSKRSLTKNPKLAEIVKAVSKVVEAIQEDTALIATPPIPTSSQKRSSKPEESPQNTEVNNVKKLKANLRDTSRPVNVRVASASTSTTSNENKKRQKNTRNSKKLRTQSTTGITLLDQDNIDIGLLKALDTSSLGCKETGKLPAKDDPASVQSVADRNIISAVRTPTKTALAGDTVVDDNQVNILKNKPTITVAIVEADSSVCTPPARQFPENYGQSLQAETNADRQCKISTEDDSILPLVGDNISLEKSVEDSEFEPLKSQNENGLINPSNDASASVGRNSVHKEKKISPKNTQSTLGTQNKKEDRHLGVGAKTVTENSMEPYDVFDFIDELENDLCDRVKKRTQTRETNRGNHTENKVSTLQVEKGNNRKAAKRKRGHSRKNSKQKVKFSDYENEKDRVDKTETTANLEPKAEKVSSHLEKKNIEQNLNGNVVNIEDDDSLVFPQRKRKRVQFDKDSNAQVHTDKDKTDSNIKYGNKRNRTKVWTYNEEMLNEMSELVDTESTMTQDEIMILSGDKDGDVKTKTSNQDRDSIMGKGGEDVQFDKTLAQQNSALSKNDAMLPPNEEPSQPKTFSQERSCIMERADKSMNSQNSRSFESDIVPASVSSSDSASKIIDAMEPMKGRLQQKGRLERISVKNVSDIKEQKDQSFGPKKRGRKPKCTTKENEKDRADGTDDIDPKTFNVDVRSVVDDDNSHDEHRKPHTKPKESEKQQSDQYVETLISIGFNVEAVELNGHNETGGSGFVLNGTRSKESIRSTVTDEKDTLTDDINAKPQSHELQQMNRAKNRAGRSRTKRGKIMQNDGSVGDVAPTFQDKALRSSEQARDSITQGKQATPLVMQETEEMVVSENSASSFHPGVDLTDDTTQCTAVDYNEPFVALESISREDKTRVSDAVHVRAKSRTGRSRTKKGRITQNDGSVGDVVPTLQDKTLRSREQGRDSVQQGKQATPLVIQETEEMVVSESTVNDASNFYPGKDLTDDTTQCTAIDNNEPSVVLERIGREDKTQVRNAEHIKTTDMEVIQNNLQSSQEKEIILDEKCSWQSEELFSSQSREKQSVKSSNETFLSQHSKSDNSQTTELRKEEKQISEQSPLEELSNSQKAAKQGLSSSGETVATKQPKQRKSKAERLKRKKKLISEVIVENSTKSKHDDVSESLVEGNCEVHPDNELQENTENSTSLLLGSSKIVKGKETQRTRVPKTVNKDPRRQSAPAYIFASAAIFELNPNMKFGNYSLNLGQLERSSLNMLEPSDNKTDMNSCESICISCKRKIFTKVSEKAFDNIKIASSPPVNLQRKVLCRDSDIAPSRTDTDFKNISIPLNEKEPGEEVIEASSREPNHDDNFDSSNIVEGIKNSLDLHDSNLPLLPENKTAEKDNETNVKNDERFTTRVNQERDTPFDDETNLSLSNRNEDRGTNSHAVMPDNPSLNQNFTQGENDIENGPANVGDVEFYSSDENDDKDAVNDVENPKLPLADYINEHHTDDNVTVSVDRDDDQQLYNDGDKAETFLADDNNMDATVNDPANPEMPLLDDNDFEDMEINGDRESVKGSISVPADQGKASLKERNEPGFGRFASNKTKDKNSSKVTKEKSKSEVIGQKSRNLTDTSTAYSKKYESESLFDSRLTTDESSPRTTEVIPPTPPCSAVKDRGSPDDSIIRKTPSNQQKRKPKNIKKPSGSDSVDLNKPESKAEVTRKRSKNKSHQDVTFGLLCHDNPVKVPNSEQVFDQNDEKPNQRAPQVISDSEDGIQSNEVLFDGESESIISPPKTMEESMKIINDGGISEEEMGPKEQSTSRSADNIEKVPCEVQSGPTKVIKNDRTRSVSSSLPPDQHSPISLPKRPHVNSSPGNHPAQRHLTSTPPRRSRLPNRNYISPHKSQSKSSFLKQVSSWPEYQCKVKTNRLVLGELSPSHSPARTNTRKGTSGLQERMVKEGTLGFHSPNTTDKNLKALGDELYVQHRDVADVDKEDLESRHPRKQVRNDSNMDDENGRKHVKSVLDDENCSLDSEDDGHLNKKSRKKKILIDDDSDSDEEEDEDSILMKPAFPEVKLARVDATPEHSRNQEKKISAPEEEKPDKSLSAFRKVKRKLEEEDFDENPPSPTPPPPAKIKIASPLSMNPVIEKLHQILSPDDTDASSTETNTAIKNHPDKVVERHYTADRTHSKPSILDKNGMSSREFKRNNPVPDESHTHMLKSPSPARRDGTVELKKRERKILTTPTIEVVDDDDSRRDGGVDSNKNTRTSEESIPRRKAIVIVTSRLTKKQMMYCKVLAERTGCECTPDFSNRTTHVVMGTDDSLAIDRTAYTYKYLMGLVTGARIVSFKWTIASLKAGKLVNEDPFEVRGDPAVGQEMVPRIARLSTASKEPPLLDGLTVCLKGEFKGNQVTYDQLKRILGLVGAKILDDLPGSIPKHNCSDPSATVR